MDFMELSRDTTRFRRELQYLRGAAWSERAGMPGHGRHAPAAAGAFWPEGPTPGARRVLSPGVQTTCWTATDPRPRGQQTPRVQR